MISPSHTNAGRTVGVLGGRGMLGSDLVRFLGERYKVQAIDRENYDEHRGQQFDVLVNANGNSKRFWANENPLEDFELSTFSVIRSIFDFRYRKYVYISSPDVYEDPTSPATTLEHSPGRIQKLPPYGFHKRLSEELVKHYTEDFLILRLAALLGTRLKKGIVYNVLQGNKLFVTPDSRVQFITTAAVADIIKVLLDREARKEIFNVGGRGTVVPETIGVLAEKPVLFLDDAKRQQYEMNIEKILGVYNTLKTSEEYVRVFIKEQQSA